MGPDGVSRLVFRECEGVPLYFSCQYNKMSLCFLTFRCQAAMNFFHARYFYASNRSICARRATCERHAGKGMTHDSLPVHRGKGRPRAFDRSQALRSALEVFWRRGYEPASVAELCAAMGINPPSLYAAFGSKAALFLEAIRSYEKTYWEAPARRFLAEPDVYTAVENFFHEAAQLLLSPETPCGCMIVLAAVNISDDETDIIAAIGELRRETKRMFADRLRQAILEGHIPADTDVPALAGALNTMLEGLSLQARDGLFQSELKAIAAHAVRMLPPRHTGAALLPAS